MDWLSSELLELGRSGLRRRLPAAVVRQGPIVDCEGVQLVNFASNDYLGLASDLRVIAAAINACREMGVGRGASPLICGRAPIHAELERRLAAVVGTEAALLFPSGFAANSGVVPALVDEPDALYADAKNHASLIDGCRLSRAQRYVYPHNDCDALERLLVQGAAFRRRLVVTDALFSMDGDVAQLPRLAALAKRYGAMLLVDEAHAIGVMGRRGGGAWEYFSEKNGGPDDAWLDQRSLIRVGTLSKAWGSAGGFVCGSGELIEWIANRARTYVFSTAAPAAAAAAALAAMEISEAEPQRRAQLVENASNLRRSLQLQGWDLRGAERHILPLSMGRPETALAASEALRKAGFWAPAIRPPSVPDGESLLRLSVRADHTPAMLQGLTDALASCPRDPRRVES